MTEVAQDLRIALRQLRRSPGFAATAILTLALGIGANTAIFSALNATLLKLLPVRDPQQLYTVLLVNGGTQPPNTSGTGYGNTSFSYPVFQALRQKTNVLADLIAHIPLSYGKIPVRLGDTVAEKAGEEVSGNYFSGLGVPMELGRGLTEAEESGHSPVTVISYRFWQEAFARDPGAIGKTLYIKGVPFTIVGVTAPSFFGVSRSGAMDFWIPLQTRPELNAWGERSDRCFAVWIPKWWDVPMLARLHPGISPDQAQSILQPTFWQAASEGAGTLDPKRWPAHLGFEPVRGIAGAADHYQTSIRDHDGLGRAGASDRVHQRGAAGRRQEHGSPARVCRAHGCGRAPHLASCGSYLRKVGCWYARARCWVGGSLWAQPGY